MKILKDCSDSENTYYCIAGIGALICLLLIIATAISAQIYSQDQEIQQLEQRVHRLELRR